MQVCNNSIASIRGRLCDFVDDDANVSTEQIVSNWMDLLYKSDYKFHHLEKKIG